MRCRPCVTFIRLSGKQIEEEVSTAERPWVVMYYADWCPHCHHYAPTFQRWLDSLTFSDARIAKKMSPLHQGLAGHLKDLAPSLHSCLPGDFRCCPSACRGRW